jgi:deoxyinosine 3'endonuclease (endonuclease V)
VREDSLLKQAVHTLPTAPEVLLINATGRDHPRRAGLAVHPGPCSCCQRSGDYPTAAGETA